MRPVTDNLRRCLSTSALMVATAAGCSSTGVGNPGFQTQGLALTEDGEVEPNADDTQQLEPGTVNHAVLVFGELRFVACDSTSSDVVLDGPFVVDLLANRVEPEIPEIVWPEGGVCGLDATLAPATRPRLLEGRSMLFSGIREGTLFVLVADMPGTLRMRPRAGGEWSPSEHQWLWALRPRRWVLPAELASETGDTGSAVDAVSDVVDTEGVDRVIAINVNRHPILYALIRTRLASRSTLHVDANDNGKVDESERAGGRFIGLGLDDIE
jgi:hypothetical protein